MPFATVTRSGSIPNTSAPNQRAEAAEAGDHLVGDQQHVVPAQHLLDRARSSRRGGDDHAARALERLADEGGDRLGALGEDQLLEIVRQLLRELLVAHARLGLPEPVRRRRVPDHRQRQVEAVVQALQPGEPGGHRR